MFIQYHDIIKPAYLYTIFKLVITNQSYGLPIDIIKDYSIESILEWYLNRRYKNPLKQLDFINRLSLDQLDDLLYKILREDESIYTLAPQLNVCKLFEVYRQQHMTFPIYVYSEKEEPFIKTDCEEILSGINYDYLYGDLKTAISNCDQNFTYIFSDIDLLNNSIELLRGTYSHILLAGDYRYNYTDAFQTTKYNLGELSDKTPIIRTGIIMAMDEGEVIDSFNNIIGREDE